MSVLLVWRTIPHKIMNLSSRFNRLLLLYIRQNTKTRNENDYRVFPDSCTDILNNATQKHPGYKKVKPSWKHHLMFNICLSCTCD